MNAKSKFLQLTPLILLFLALLSTLLVATNPEHTFPLLPELFLVGSFSFCILCYAKQPPALQTLELWLIASLVVNAFCLLLPRLVLHILDAPGQQWIPCLTVGNAFYEMECFFHSAVGGHSGVRTFYMLLTALFSGISSFVLVRLRPGFWKQLFAMIAALSVLHSALALFGRWTKQAEILPHWIMVPEYGLERLTAVFSNPGWIWPYHLPGLVVVLWGSLYAEKIWVRILNFLSLLLLSFTCVVTLQRGGLLLVVMLWTLGIIVATTKRIQSRKNFLILSLLMAFALAAGFYAFHQQVDQGLMTSLQSGKSLISSSNERIAIWKAAWELFKERPLTGYGYASWYPIIVGYRDQVPAVPAFDTAHNLFVQLFVELGALHGLLIVSLFAGLGLLLLRDSKDVSGRAFLGFSLIVGSLVCTLVQELDYIRPTYYTFAAMAGAALGLRPLRDPKLRAWEAGGRVLVGIRATVWMGLVLALVGLIVVRFYFASHMFGFESNVRVKADRVERWGGPSITLPAYATPGLKYYSNFEVNSWAAPQTVRLGAEGMTLLVPPQTAFSLPLQNGSRLIPERHRISALGQRHPPRMIGLRFAYPPVQTNTAMVFSEGMYGWEDFDGIPGRWCGKECWMVAKTCRSGLRLTLRSPIPEPLAQRIHWKAWKLGQSMDRGQLFAVMEHEAEWKGSLSFASDQPLTISVPPVDESYFLISFAAAESFVPSEAVSGSTDGRTLSFMVLDGSCLL